MDNILLVLIPIVIAMFLLSAMQLALENSYFVVMNVGKFAEFRGPGLHFKWIKLAIGNRGKLLNLLINNK